MKDEIRDAVKQWQSKAKSDWTTVEVLLASEQCPYDTVCFHCQQYVEKLLKALLTLHSIETPKTHDLRRLVQLAQPYVPKLSSLADLSDSLTAHGVQSRYPGDFTEISHDDMNEMVALAKQFADILLPHLPN